MNSKYFQYNIYDLDSTLEFGQIMVLNKTVNTNENMFKNILNNILSKKPYEIWCLSELCFNSVIYERKILLNYEEYLQLLKFRYSKKPKSIIGITGSYGKTSSAYFLYEILNQLNYKSCLSCSMGIINYKNNQFCYGGLSTLGLASLYRFLHENHDCDFGIIEVSSIAAEQNRTGDIEFNGGIFTAFSIDHLDMHSSLESYFDAKKNFIQSIKGPVVKYKHIKNLDIEEFPSENYYIINHNKLFINNKIIELNNSVVPYQMQNILGCLTLLDKLNLLSLDNLIKLDITEPKGRMEYIGKTKYNSFVYVDGAHAAEQVDHMLKSINADYNDTVIVYGAAGNRLKTDLQTADFLEQFKHVIITDDLPGSVNNYYILNKLKKPHFIIIPNRFDAIKFALKFHNKKIIILGKSSETSNKIVYENHCIYYNEVYVITELLYLLNGIIKL